jgi:predicted phage-related endonuclease
VRNADDTADILRTEAQDVAIAQTLRSQIVELEKSCHAIEQQNQALTQQQRNTLAKWQALWQPLGISALSPAEMIENA